MPDETRPGFTLDLSSAASGKPKRPRGFVPVVQKTINLTTRKRDEAPSAPETPADVQAEVPRQAGQRLDEPRRNKPSGNRDGGNRGGGRRDEARRDEVRPDGRSGGGTSLADLLDDATLARLRGGK